MYTCYQILYTTFHIITQPFRKGHSNLQGWHKKAIKGEIRLKSCYWIISQSYKSLLA